MLSPECLGELHGSWLPNITDTGLDRLIELLEKGSPMLIHGCFTKAVPMGCLASHVAWNHPNTCHLTLDAGITWLHKVACLNPATSLLMREWDLRGACDVEMRGDLMVIFQAERASRRSRPSKPERRRVAVEA